MRGKNFPLRRDSNSALVHVQTDGSFVFDAMTFQPYHPYNLKPIISISSNHIIATTFLYGNTLTSVGTLHCLYALK